MNQTKEEVASMMEMLLDLAKQDRESHKYSEDEKVIPKAFIYGDDEVTIMLMDWKDTKTKYEMAMFANLQARLTKAKSLSFATDTRWVKSDVFCDYFKLPRPNKNNMDAFRAIYHNKLAEYGGQVKNFPREIWAEAVTVFTNGPGIPVTIQMAPYKEGPNDTIEWLPREGQHNTEKNYGKSDLLTDWWA